MLSSISGSWGQVDLVALLTYFLAVELGKALHLAIAFTVVGLGITGRHHILMPGRTGNRAAWITLSIGQLQEELYLQPLARKAGALVVDPSLGSNFTSNEKIGRKKLTQLQQC